MTSEDLRRRNASLHDRIEQVLEMHPELRDWTETIALNQDLHVEVGAPFLERTRDKLLERMQAITKGRPELEHYFDDLATAVAFPETTSRETSSRPQSAPTWRCVLRLIEKLNRTQSKIAFWLCAVGIVAIGATRLGSGTVAIFAFCCLTAFALLNEALGSRFEGVSKLGDLTYASYLLHFPIQVPSSSSSTGSGSAGMSSSRHSPSLYSWWSPLASLGSSSTASRCRRRTRFARSRCRREPRTPISEEGILVDRAK
jgi:hypothetical protein